MRVLTDHGNEDTIEMTNLVLSNESYCKVLLGIYLNTKSSSIIDKYYDVYIGLREKGHFDPDIEGSGFSWNWSAFFFGPLFFWYRKQYGYMVGVVIAMFFFFFPGLILSGAIANLALMNGFALAVARGLDKAGENEEIMNKLKKLTDADDEKGYFDYFNENVCPYIESACKRLGGTDAKAILIPAVLIIAIVFLANFGR